MSVVTLTVLTPSDKCSRFSGPVSITTVPSRSCFITPATRQKPVADPGFPQGGGANSRGGHQHKILPNFPKNCMKLKEFGPPGASLAPPLDPPLEAMYFGVKDSLPG